MQTVTWSRIEDWLLSLTGNDSFSTDEKAWIKSAVNRRIRMAYEESPFWPRYINEELRTASLSNVIPFDETSKDSIDTLLSVWDSDPRKRISTAQRYESVPRSDGFQVLGLSDQDTTPTDFWCSYKAQLTDYFGDGTSGTNTSVPVEFQEYAVHGAYADWLRMEGQNGKALAEEQFARESLERQLERIYYTSGSPVISSNFNTHSKSQSR